VLGVPKSDRVTLQDIANEIGITAATVSMALRGHRRISPETRERVRQVAGQLGYRPDPLVSGLARYRRPGGEKRGAVIALVSFRPPRPVGAEAELISEGNALGYDLQPFYLDDYPTQQALTRVLKARGIAGVLFPERVPPIRLEANAWQGLCCVYTGPYPGSGEVDCPVDLVRLNPFDCVVSAWTHARRAGYRRIGLNLLAPEQGLTNLDRKTMAAFAALQREEKKGFPRLQPLIEVGEPALTTCRQWVEQERPEVVLGGINRLYSTLQEAGCRIPEEVRFIALRKARPRSDIAGLLVGVRRVHSIAIRHLDALIRQQVIREPEEQITLVLKPVWSPGASFPE